MTFSSVRATLAFKTASSLAFAPGVAIHVGRPPMGFEFFVRSVFTRPVNVGFAMLILIVRVPLHLHIVRDSTKSSRPDQSGMLAGNCARFRSVC
jgi:hypothetical protein